MNAMWERREVVDDERYERHWRRCDLMSEGTSSPAFRVTTQKMVRVSGGEGGEDGNSGRTSSCASRHLILAATGGHADALEYLLSGANRILDVDVRKKLGEMALHEAARVGGGILC